MAPAKPVVFVVSDSLGETADSVTRAAVAQFDFGSVEIRRFPMVENARDLDQIAEAAAQQPCLIVYTLIVPEVRRLFCDMVAARGLLAVDIMGPMLDGLSSVLGTQPRLQPGLMRKLDAEYFQRVEAVEFAVKYDDGKDPRGCLLADVVLLGVSRSSKTPVSMYLAHRKVKVANIPLVPEVNLPQELFQVAHKVVGLYVDAQKLLQIREERLRTMGLRTDANYANMERIHQELDYARTVFRQIGCPVVDATNRAVEETAIRILEHIGKGAKFSD